MPVLTTFTTVAGTVNVAALTAPVNVAVPPMSLRANVSTPLTVVPVTSAPATAPVLKFNPKVAPVTAPRVMSLVPATALVSKETFAPKVIAAKVIAASVVETSTLRIAGLATVNALSKLELTPENVTPVPAAVRVVMPVITPPLVTPSTVMVPAPAAVMFNAPVVVSKARSALSRLKSAAAPAVPKNTFTFELLVMLIFAPALKVGAAVKLRSLAVIDRFPPIAKVPKSSRFISVIATSNAPAKLLFRLTKPPKLFACVRVIAAPCVTIFVTPTIVSAPV